MNVVGHEALLAAAATTFLSVGVALPANASSNQAIQYGGWTRAQAFWYTSSQSLVVYDTYEEGWGGRSQWTRGTNSGVCDVTTGQGTNHTCGLSFGTGKSFFYNVCVKNGSTIIQCTPGLNDVT